MGRKVIRRGSSASSMTDETITDVQPSRTQKLAQWMLEREAAKAEQEVDKTYRMLKLNTFLTLAVLAVVGGQDNADLVMSLLFFL